MNRDLAILVELAEKHSFVFELIGGKKQRSVSLLFFDGNDVVGYYFVTQDDPDTFDSFVKELFSRKNRKICFGMRQILDHGLDFKSYCDIVDVSLFFDGERLQNVGNSHLSEGDVREFNEASRKMSAHVKACEIAKIDIQEQGVCNAIPSKVVIGYHRAMAVIVLGLYMKLTSEQIDSYENDFSFFAALYRMEQNGIYVDVDRAPVSLSASERRFMEELKKHTDSSGLLKIRFAVRATKTDRLTIERGSFNFMTIPSTPVRSVIKSRFEGGKIVSFDFNAIDYRCIISSIDDLWLKSQYDSDVDFHSRTVELVLGKGTSNDIRRNILKTFTYVVMYGGAESSLNGLGLGKEKVALLYKKVKRLLSPVQEWGQELYSESMGQGYVEIPGGKKIPLQGHERPSYVLAIYGQGCSSRVFADAVTMADVLLHDKKSVGMFTVHDEYVVDVHPDELNLIGEIARALEESSMRTFEKRFKVNVSEGNDYWEVT